MICPDCNSTNVVKNGMGHTNRQHYKCADCGYNFPEKDGSTSFEQGDDFINIVCASKRMLTKEDLIKKFKVNLDIWEIEKFKLKTSEGYRKDRKVKWKVKNGVVTEGDVDDSGKMLVAPLYHIEIRFRRKIKEETFLNFRDTIIKEIQKHKPKYNVIKYKKDREPYLYEINPSDLHYGKHTWGKETGEDYDIEIAGKNLSSCINDHLRVAQQYSIDKFLFVVGNDFFNVDNKSNTTASGTPQQEDTRWKKTFSNGLKLLVGIIDKLRIVAPVDILVIPGNHDLERAYYLGVALSCWYRSVDGVSVDNSPSNRKYYSYGKCLIGFTHGKDEKLTDLPTVMAIEQPELYAKSKYREWHTGDKHHQKKIETVSIDENNGVTVRILRSISPADQWHHSKGYIGSLKSVEGFLWHKEMGLKAHLFANL